MIPYLWLAIALTARGADTPPTAAAPATAAPLPATRALPALAPDAPPLERALHAELSRGLSGLKLPDAQAPYLLAGAGTEGEMITVLARSGSVIRSKRSPLRNARIESHLGTYAEDSFLFGGWGDDGLTLIDLPETDDVLALRRSIWLGLDSAYKGSVAQQAAQTAARRGKPPRKVPDFGPADIRSTEGPAPVRMEGLDLAALERMAARVSGAALVDPRIEGADIDAMTWSTRRVLLSSEGHRVWTTQRWTVARLTAVARMPDASLSFDERTWIVRDVADLDVAAMEREAREMGQWMVRLASAPVEENYLGPVVFEGQAATELFSQLLVPEIGGTPPSDDESGGTPPPPTARIGRRILPPGWSVVDDGPGHLDRVGVTAFDYEGVPLRRLNLVEDGVVREVVMSRVPRADRRESTGHARYDGGRLDAMPAVVDVRAGSTVSSAKLRKKALKLAATLGRDHVLVVRRMSPGANDGAGTPIESDVPAGITSPIEAFRLYADGREEPVRSMQFSGVDRRTLRDIVAATESRGWTVLMDGPPTSGRGQGVVGGVPVHWSVPDVLVSELELLGGGGGEARILGLERPPAPAAQ
jgi:TldD protein